MAVQIAERWILARLRHERFFSLAALNARIAELLVALNANDRKYSSHQYNVLPLAVARGLATFGGVKRRMEVRGEAAGVTVLDDFAHHPTALVETIRAIRELYPGRRLWALLLVST